MSRSVKKWDIDWDAAAALIDFAKLTAEEIAVALQMINLMYVQNGAIDNSPADIKNYIKNMGKAKCAKVIHTLINRDVPKSGFFLENGKISHKKVMEILKNREENFKNARLFGKKGGETKKENEQKQGDNYTPPTESLPSSLPSSPESLKTFSPSVTAEAMKKITGGIGRGGYSIWSELTEEGERKARAAAPGWNIRETLAPMFDEKVRSGKFQRPNEPDEAFAAWCGKYTKGKPPR